MKKIKLLQESLGIIDKDGVQWYDLCDLITEYVFDIKNGLNNDIDIDNEETPKITKGNIEGYYQFIHSSKIPKYIIPDWVGKFKILLMSDKASSGTFTRNNANLTLLKKLDFVIEINDKLSPDGMNNTLVHEFQHAYSYWLELIKNFNFISQNKAKLYNSSLQTFDFNKYQNIVPTAIQTNTDYLDINNQVFDDANSLERTILQSFYLGSVGEIRSYSQEFANDIMHQIKRNISKIREEIKDSMNLKNGYSSKTPDEKWRSNVLNNLSISCFNSSYYVRYLAYYNFFKILEKRNIDDDVATQIVNNIKKPIKLFLKIPVTKKIIHFEGDAENILKQVAKKQIPIYEASLKRMQRMFAKIIMDIPVK